MTNIQQRSILLLAEVVNAKYFLDELSAALNEQGVTVAGIEKGEYNDQDLVMMWNEFWLRLPDDMSCRRAPFFELCDLCEEIFNDDEVD